MQTTRARYLARWAALKNERSSWIDHWRELDEWIQPRRGRFLLTDRNQGGKKNGNIINGTAQRALRTLTSGMMAGITSPARPWFRLSLADPELMKYGPAKEWLHETEEAMRHAYAKGKSNFYSALYGVYRDLGQFGTSAMLLETSPKDLLRGYNWPVGQYALANSPEGRVDTAFREFSMTVGQLVTRFGEQACSQLVRNQYKQGYLDKWIDVTHVICPNADYQEGKIGAAGKPWHSHWMESAGDEQQPMLLTSGYFEFPLLAPRWDTLAEDVYGSSPGMDALGDVRALQLYEKRKAQAVDKIVNPPMRAPASMMNSRVSLLPGETTFGDVPQGGQRFEPAMEVRADAIVAIEKSIREHEGRINGHFFADLWLMLANSEGDPQKTAREIVELHDEKMLQLGPVLERLQAELLDPAIDRTFNVMQRAGALPPMPEELAGQDLRVEYISPLAQAQKLIATGAVERLVGFVTNLGAMQPEALDKLDTDKVIDEYANMVGTKPDLIRTDDEVAKIRDAKAKAMQAKQQGEAALAATQGAKNLADTDVGGQNLLNSLMGTPVGAVQ